MVRASANFAGAFFFVVKFFIYSLSKQKQVNMKNLVIRASLDGDEYTGLWNVIDENTGFIEVDEVSKDEALKIVKDYKDRVEKAMIFLTLSDQLTPQQCRNIVDSNLKAINRRRSRKIGRGFSFWTWLLGSGDLNTGGVFDLHKDKF